MESVIENLLYRLKVFQVASLSRESGQWLANLFSNNSEGADSLCFNPIAIEEKGVILIFHRPNGY